MLAMGNFNRGSRSGGGRDFERSGFRDRDSRGPVQMHQAVCDNCRKDCEVPFRPTSGKPIFCSNCFGDKKRGGDRSRERFQPQANQFASGATKEQFEQLNHKLDKILGLLTPKEFTQPVAIQKETVEEVNEKKTKASKKKSSNFAQ